MGIHTYRKRLQYTQEIGMKDYTEFRRTIDKTLKEGIVRDTAIRVGRKLGIEKAKRAQTSGEESADRQGKERQRSGSVDEVETGGGTRYRARWEDEFRYFDTWSDASDWVEGKKRPGREAQSRRDAEERDRGQRERERDERERERSRRRTPLTRYNPHSGHDEPVDD